MFNENVKEMSKRKGVNQKDIDLLNTYCKGAIDGMDMIKTQFVNGVLSMN